LTVAVHQIQQVGARKRIFRTVQFCFFPAIDQLAVDGDTGSSETVRYPGTGIRSDQNEFMTRNDEGIESIDRIEIGVVKEQVGPGCLTVEVDQDQVAFLGLERLHLDPADGKGRAVEASRCRQ